METMEPLHRLCERLGRRFGLVIVTPNPSTIGNTAEEMYFALLKARREGKKALLLFPWCLPGKLGFRLANRALFALESPHRVARGAWTARLGELLVTLVYCPLQFVSRLLHKFRGRPLPRAYALPGIGVATLWQPEEDMAEFSWAVVDGYRWEEQLSRPLPVGLSERDRRRGEARRRDMGLPAEARFACLHVREGGFHGDSIAARNATIANYIPAIREITARGFWVVRMGDATMAPLPPLERVIDYPHSRFKSELMDIYLLQECKFYVGMASGIMDAAFLFQKPHVLTNLATWTIAYPMQRGDLAIIKHVFSLSEGRYLSLRELLSTELEAQFVFGLGPDYRMVENTPDEIRDVIVEFLDDPAGRPMSDLQERFNRARIEQGKRLFSKPVHRDPAFERGFRYRFASRLDSVRGCLGRRFVEQNWEYSQMRFPVAPPHQP